MRGNYLWIRESHNDIETGISVLIPCKMSTAPQSKWLWKESELLICDRICWKVTLELLDGGFWTSSPTDLKSTSLERCSFQRSPLIHLIYSKLWTYTWVIKKTYHKVKSLHIFGTTDWPTKGESLRWEKLCASQGKYIQQKKPSSFSIAELGVA